MGDMKGVDATSLASLTAGNVAAMGGLAKLIGEKEFPNQFHEGERESLLRAIDVFFPEPGAPKEP